MSWALGAAGERSVADRRVEIRRHFRRGEPLADIVYEGARSVTGPILALLGANAIVVGIVTGIGEAAALLLRLISAPLADPTRRFWAWAIAGFTITEIAVPTLGFASDPRIRGHARA